MSGIPSIVLGVVPKEYIPPLPFINKKESFATSNNGSSASTTVLVVVYQLINMAICFGALYYAFKCGGHFLEVLGACCCSFCYLVYRLAKGCSEETVAVAMQAPATS